MLETILRHLNNWFVHEIHAGTYTVVNGGMELPFLQDGQYFRIIGSVFNDGLHQYPSCNLLTETFDGVVQALAIPREVIDLSTEIAEWVDKHPKAMSPYNSESFAGYSYTKATDPDTGVAAGWQTIFRTRLNRWRKI